MWTTWGQPGSVFLVTTNSYVRAGGRLVMGRGIAKQLRDRTPYFARMLGEAIRRTGPLYGLIVLDEAVIRCEVGSARTHRGFAVGAFQVKHHYRDQARLDLIEYSSRLLAEYCQRHPAVTVNLNYPGIGFGHLSEATVEPSVRKLPESVVLWRFASERPAQPEEDECSSA